MRILLCLLVLLPSLCFASYSEYRDDDGNLIEVSRGDNDYREVRDPMGYLLRVERREHNLKILRDRDGSLIGTKRYDPR